MDDIANQDKFGGLLAGRGTEYRYWRVWILNTQIFMLAPPEDITDLPVLLKSRRPHDDWRELWFVDSVW